MLTKGSQDFDCRCKPMTKYLFHEVYTPSRGLNSKYGTCTLCSQNCLTAAGLIIQDAKEKSSAQSRCGGLCN